MEEVSLSIVDAKKEIRLQEWQERIKECRSSGLPVTQWCQENNIGIKRYYYWHRKLWKREVRQFAEAERKNEPMQFARIEVQSTGNHEIKIQKNGWIIEVGNGADPQMLRQIMQMAAEDV